MPQLRCLLLLLLLLLLLAQVTPFLLESIRSKTGGTSLAANIQLVKNNAAVGSQIAVALAAMS
jgi:pseudouridine-5'-phosphate glycosidase